MIDTHLGGGVPFPDEGVRELISQTVNYAMHGVKFSKRSSSQRVPHLPRYEMAAAGNAALFVLDLDPLDGIEHFINASNNVALSHIYTLLLVPILIISHKTRMYKLFTQHHYHRTALAR